MSDKKIIHALLLYGLDDMLDLGWIRQTVGLLQAKKRDDPEVFESSMEAIQDLLEANYAIAGLVVKDPVDGLLRVQSWELSPPATVERIRQRREECDERDQRYLVWLELTELGRREAERLDGQGCNPFGDGKRED